MEFKEMSVEALMERRAAIAAEIDAPEADLDALTREAEGIKAELEARKAAEEKRAAIRDAVAMGEGEVTKNFKPVEERKIMTNEEIRSSKEYINAFAEYIKSGDDAECRALLTENTTGGTVAVPTLVYDIVKTAWEREGIMSRVRKSYLKGNLKVGFEISSSDAVVHTEGVTVSEETLVLGVVELVPKAIKKWISISDEAYDMRGEAFLRYIYDELTYRIAKKAADTLVAAIVSAPVTSTTTAPGQPAITATQATMGLVASAIANLSDEATNPCIMMNKLTWAAFKNVQYANGYGADPFEGLPVVFNDSISALSAATTGVTWMIVGDLDHGALANFPAGEEIGMKYDDTTLATQDLVRVIGREYVALGVVAPGAFVRVKH
jgi:HK97 family phage major capsid protein